LKNSTRNKEKLVFVCTVLKKMSAPFSPYYAAIISFKRVIYQEANESDDEKEGFQDLGGKEDKLEEEILDIAKKQSGFLGFDNERNGRDNGLHVAYWKDKDSIEKWEKEANEIISQKIEIDSLWDYINIRICKVKKDYKLISHSRKIPVLSTFEKRKGKIYFPFFSKIFFILITERKKEPIETESQITSMEVLGTELCIGTLKGEVTLYNPQNKSSRKIREENGNYITLCWHLGSLLLRILLLPLYLLVREVVVQELSKN
jgi:heme-degrading monooxygenase HmoA